MKGFPFVRGMIILLLHQKLLKISYIIQPNHNYVKKILSYPTLGWISNLSSNNSSNLRKKACR